jgi:hypothetical protein
MRPTILNIEGDGSSSSEHRFGDTIRVHYEGPVVTSASITSPAAVTHGTEMNSRTAFLEISNHHYNNARRDLRRPSKPGHGRSNRLMSGSSTSSSSKKQVGSMSDTTASTTNSGYVDLVLPTRQHRVTAPGWHMLFLMHEKSPSHEAVWIKLVDDLETAEQ